MAGRLTANDIEKAELAVEARKQSRRNGFSLMEVRDEGHATLSNGVVIHWHVHKELEEGEVRRSIPPWGFGLDIRDSHGKRLEILFDTEEFRKWLRWA